MTVLTLLVMAFPTPLEGQTLRLDLGLASSSVEWIPTKPSPITSISSNTNRKFPTAAAAVRYSPQSWWAGEAGLQIMPKGFDVTTPTFHMTYAEVPVRGILQTGPEAGLFLEGGLVLGVRVTCSRFMNTVAGFHEDGCGRAVTAYGRELAPLRWGDASWELGVGGRIPLRNEGQFVVTIRAQRSFIDIQPEKNRWSMRNQVLIFTAGYEWPAIPWRSRN